MSMTLDQIRELAVKSVIPRVEGTLQAVYEAKSGKNDKGPYRTQSVILSQGDDSMKAFIVNGPSVDKSMEGEEVVIMCSKGPKGLSGVTTQDNEWPRDSGTINREIRMDRTGRIMLLAEAPKNGEAPPVAAATTANKTPVAVEGKKPTNGWGKSPDQQWRIERQHSQEMAIRFMGIEPRLASTPPTLERIKELTDHFHDDLTKKVVKEEKPADGTDPAPF